MKILETNLNEVFIITPNVFGDNRGYFFESYNKKKLKRIVNLEFFQDNESLSKEKYTFRGLHFQSEPMAQDKLVRVIKGKALDIVLDLRKSSKTYLKHQTFEISEENKNQIWVPKGFAHGVLILEENTILNYKVTNFYSPEHDNGISINSPDLNIELPVDFKKLILSEKDKKLEIFDKNKIYFK